MCGSTKSRIICPTIRSTPISSKTISITELRKMEWDPKKYDKFRAAREQPFADVVALIEPVAQMPVVDLGCGPGSLTRKLGERFHQAEIVGIDSSQPMLDKANELATSGLRFVAGDIE